MFNAYAVGFVCVAATAALGVDYVTQARQAGARPGEFALAAYAGTVPARVADALSAADKTRRQARSAREYLPQAAAGWERGKWERDAEADDAAMRGLSFLEQRALKDAIKQARKAAREEVYEYVRGADVVRLSARFEPRPGEGARPGRVTAFVSPEIDPAAARLEGYDIVQGVFFFRLADPATGAGADPEGPVMLQAWLGDGLAIGVYADRPVEGLPALLDAIDYGALNAMLDEPVAHVGRDALPVPEGQKARLLELAAAAHMADPAALPAAADAGDEAASMTGAPARMAAGGGGQALSPARPAPKDTVSRLTPGQAGQAGGQGGNAGPKRLTLSGGRSCLGASSGRLCD